MEANALLPWLFVIKMGLYSSALVAAGVGLHAALAIVEQDQHQRALRTAGLAALAGVGFAFAKFVVLNAQLGGSLNAAFDTSTVGWTWRAQSSSVVALVAGTGGLIAAWVLRAPALAFVGAVGVSASFALTGHTQALEPPGIVPLLVAVHVLIAAYWLAAPITLWPTPSLTDEELRVRLRRFSAIAVYAIPLLFGLGLYLAWQLAGSTQAVLATEYGRLLLAKLGIATVALVVGAANKVVVTRTLTQDSIRGRKMLQATLTLDIVLFVAALMIVGYVTTFTGPTET